LHLLGVVMIVLALPSPSAEPARQMSTSPPPIRVVLPRIVFVPTGPIGAGGGGGGNRQAGPIRHAEGVGRDAATLRTARRVAPAVDAVDIETPLPPLLLDARLLASGSIDVIGLPVGGVTYGTSTGPGSGGGGGTGSGTGIGPGHGPGIGPGSGGGFGGGAYRPGGAVTAPRVLSEVKPRYTSQALVDKIQGSVWLELIVTRDGRVDQIRVVRSLDPRGLDDEAVKAVREWRFEPGRIAGTPVDVMVTVAIDFWIR
jgi:TonB family protein